jgi:hypothetical protein
LQYVKPCNISALGESKMSKHPNRLLVISLILGILFDFLFWKHEPGINFPIFTVLVLAGGLALLITSGHRPSTTSLLTLIPVLYFSMMTCIRKEPLTLFLSITFTFLYLAIFTITYEGGRWYKYILPDYLGKLTALIGSLTARPIMFFDRLNKVEKAIEKKEAAEQLDIEGEASTEEVKPQSPKKKNQVGAIIRGILLALPVLGIFTWLLASADLVFQQKLTDAFDDNLLLRLFYIAIIGYALAGVFLHAAHKSQDEELVGEKKPFIKRFLGYTESMIVLGSVILLFISFVSIQFQYFFGGDKNIVFQGYTYSEYARRGFSELIIVAVISLFLIIGLTLVTTRMTKSHNQYFNGFCIGIVALILVMLISAYQRLLLAVDWHGFSRLRLYPQVFMIWLGLLLIVVAVLVAIDKERYFALAVLLASTGFAATLPLINVDAAVVHYNAQRTITEETHFNVTHLANLSLDAVPALVEEFQNKEYSKDVHEGIGAALQCHWHSEDYADSLTWDWKAFNLSEYQAGQVMYDAAKELKKYQVNIDGRVIRIMSPSEKWYECTEDY